MDIQDGQDKRKRRGVVNGGGYGYEEAEVVRGWVLVWVVGLFWGGLQGD